MRPVSEITLSAGRGLRIKEATDYIGSTPWFIEVAIRERKIPAHKLGRHYVLFKDDSHPVRRVISMGRRNTSSKSICRSLNGQSRSGVLNQRKQAPCLVLNEEAGQTGF